MPIYRPFSLYKGDCIEYMQSIKDQSIDLVLTDLPYGTTACKWDTIIPFEPMWGQLKRVIKSNGAVVLFGSQPFTSALVMSNLKMFKYEWVWEKSRAGGIFNAKNMPLKKHENVLVFSQGTCANCSTDRMVYNPQGLVRVDKKAKNSKRSGVDTIGNRPSRQGEYVQEFSGYPDTLLKIQSEGNTVHPTQKPVALMEYLIKTYTNEGETVLDFTMGSGTTGVACMNLGRKFLGCEKEENYFNTAKERIENAYRERQKTIQNS
jgi:site-specific DNA-methyltransferase (adenine-specific)